ncbi:hypothetical protein ACTOB_003366 [Actinoplanes oblitus]|uniref:Uncharacterized protein n=1 Tax=Actinoplanes oblitus TaxID=3040509 RepID=A0ABY8WRT5_9ACTN|nr:hypothetical protein [Actinoplanes oblitus]WIM99706.1 hypothetical protein ACTOB_003366 [Actinoplanes oblitus]
MAGVLLLVAAPLSVLLIGAEEDEKIFDARLAYAVARDGHAGDTHRVSEYAHTMRRTVEMAQAGWFRTEGEAVAQIEDAYQRALPGTLFRVPAELSASGQEVTLRLPPRDRGPGQDAVAAALDQYRTACRTALDSGFSRVTTSPRKAAVLAADENRVVAAAEAVESAGNLASRRESDEAIRKIRREHLGMQAGAAAVLGASALVVLGRRRRAPKPAE